MELNSDKTKIVRFKRGRKSKKDWRWKGKSIEEMKEFKYLEYILQKNGGQETQIRDRRKNSGKNCGAHD